MRRSMLLFLTIITALTAGASQEKPEWSNVERDVWIDQTLQRPVLVYRDQTGAYLLLSDQLPHGLIIDVGAGNITAISKSEITLGEDLASARLSHGVEPAIGRVAVTEDGILIGSAEGRSIVLAPHRSPTGDLDLASFLESYPCWRARMETYEADPIQVEALRQIDHPVEVSVIFATWCGDSRREVPRLLKAIETAGNPNILVKLIGVDSEFQEPLSVIREQRIINVPTVIVERRGSELGRIVETPASGTMEADLATIVTGNQIEHQGRWERKSMLASGAYEIDFKNGGVGRETWELFSTENGGRLTHSVTTLSGLSREVWHRFDSAGRSEFIEITDRTDEGVTRSRIRIGSDRIRVTSRGNRAGLIDQYLAIPSDCIFATGSILGEGLECRPLSERAVLEAVRYNVPLEQCVSVGCLETLELIGGSSTRLETITGEVAATEVSTRSPTGDRRVWVGTDLGIPLRVESADLTAVLVELTNGG